MYLVLALALAVDWITPPDPRLPVHGLPWYAENSGEAIRLPQRLKASLPPGGLESGALPQRRPPALPYRLHALGPPPSANPQSS